MNTRLLCLPGWCLGRGPLQATVDAVNGQFIDLPGYRETPLIDDFEAAAESIASRLPAATVLLGWSLGAQLAIAIAARAPEKIAKLVLVAATASFIQRDGWPHAMPPELLADFSAGVANDVEAMLPRFVGGFNRGDAHAKAVTLSLLKQADPRPPATTLASGLAWLRDVDLRQRAPRIKAATLLIHGSADPLMPCAAAEALADLIPAAQLSILDACAHAPFISQPAAFTTRLRQFLDE
jgi:pimeloyl-[acyl-carrier protein] methyl ester esterase